MFTYPGEFPVLAKAYLTDELVSVQVLPDAPLSPYKGGVCRGVLLTSRFGGFCCAVASSCFCVCSFAGVLLRLFCSLGWFSCSFLSLLELRLGSFLGLLSYFLYVQ